MIDRPEVTIEEIGERLHLGWIKYVELFGEAPHGTLPQMRALAALSGLSVIAEVSIPARMNAKELREYFEADPRRLSALNSIRTSKGVEQYSMDEAVIMMGCFGGCDRESFESIDRAIRAQMEMSDKSAGAY